MAPSFTEGSNEASAHYDGTQSGYYLQATYRFTPKWRVGLRYGVLSADNQFSNFNGTGIDLDEFSEESGFGSEDDPKKLPL